MGRFQNPSQLGASSRDSDVIGLNCPSDSDVSEVRLARAVSTGLGLSVMEVLTSISHLGSQTGRAQAKGGALSQANILLPSLGPQQWI